MTGAGAAAAAGVYGLATLTGRFATGVVIDRTVLHPALVMMLVLLLEACAFLALPVTTGPGRIATLLVYGLTIGAEADCLAYCVLRIFGRRHFGGIFGVLGITMLYIGTGVGPVLFALARNLAGAYAPRSGSGRGLRRWRPRCSHGSPARRSWSDSPPFRRWPCRPRPARSCR